MGRLRDLESRSLLSKGRLAGLLLLLGVLVLAALAGSGRWADLPLGYDGEWRAQSDDGEDPWFAGGPETPAGGAEDSPGVEAVEAGAAALAPGDESPEAGVAMSSAADQATATGDESLPVGLTQSFLGRKIISNAEVQVEVGEGEFAPVFDRLTEFPLRFGGYLLSSETNASAEQGAPRSGTVSLRIPSERLPEVLQAAGELGELKGRNVTSQDVTEEYVDLESRLKNARSQESSLRELLGRATEVDEILQVRNVLSSIQMEIEQLEGRLRYLEEHSDFATVTVHVFEPGIQVALTRDWGFLRALEQAGLAFVGTVNAIVVFAGGILPLALLALFAFWVGGRLRSRRSAENRLEG